eukprot:scaffold54536_cov72-Phaeocystis_antarctica.AAC.2
MHTLSAAAHLLLLSFEPRNASLPFRRVRPDNYSFVIESSNMCGGIRGVRDVWPPRCRDAHAGRDYAEIIRDLGGSQLAALGSKFAAVTCISQGASWFVRGRAGGADAAGGVRPGR